MMRKATVCEKLVTIPTYAAGMMEKNPMFLEKRAYQGSTGKVYPLPICETVSETKEDRTYRAVIWKMTICMSWCCRNLADAFSERWIKQITMILCTTIG